MRAIARRENGTLRHDVEVRGHTVVADEPEDSGGTDTGPSRRRSCSPRPGLLQRDHDGDANRKGWEVGDVVLDDDQALQRGSPTRFTMEVRLPKEMPEEQRERLMQIAAKCPVHRTLEGEVMFDERVELG